MTTCPIANSWCLTDQHLARRWYSAWNRQARCRMHPQIHARAVTDKDGLCQDQRVWPLIKEKSDEAAHPPLPSRPVTLPYLALNTYILQCRSPQSPDQRGSMIDPLFQSSVTSANL